MKDLEGRFVAVNNALARAVGTTPEDMIGKRGSDYWSMEYEKTYLEHDAIVMRTREALRDVEPFYDENGNKVCRDSIKVPTFDEHGNVSGTAGTSRDTSELHKAFLALRSNEKRLAEAERIGRVAHVEWDLKTGHVERSQVFYEILGTEPHQMTSDIFSVLPFIHPEDRDWFKRSHELFSEDGGRYNIEFRIVRADGCIRYLRQEAQAFYGEDGKPERMVGVILDVTERHEFEHELKQSREDLKRLSAQLLRLQEEEQKKIAREIHDEFGQALTALKIDLFWIKSRLNGDQRELIEKAEEMSAMIASSLQAMRGTITQLRPTLLDELGLAEAVKWSLDQFGQRAGFEARLTIEPKNVRIAPGFDAQIFRIFQEALTNIIRHSGASRWKSTFIRRIQSFA